MARITAFEAFDIHNYAFSGVSGASATSVIGNDGGYRFGITRFENTMTTPTNGSTMRAQAFGDDFVVASGNVTAGSIGTFVAQNLVGTRWVSSFVLSQMDMSAATYQSVLSSVGTNDDEAFFEAALVGADLALLSKFADHMDGYGGNDTMRGAGGNDTLYGDGDNDLISGGIGADYLIGGDGNDWVTGNFGADTVLGSDGADTINGGNGNDLLSGGSGADVFLFRKGDDSDTVTSFQDGSDMLRVVGMSAGTTWNKEQDGTSVVIDVMDVEITLLNTALANITLADFILA